MAIRLLSETLNNPATSYGIPQGVAGALTSGFSIHANHVVDFAKPLAFNFYQSSSHYNNNNLNKAFWDSIGITEGEKVSVCIRMTNDRANTVPSVYVNGGLCPDVSSRGGSNSLYTLTVREASDIILMSNPHHNIVFDKYDMVKLLLHTSEGQFTDTLLNDGYVTNVPGITTSKVTLRPNAALVQLEHRARLNRTSPNSAESSVKVQIGTKEETRILPLLGAPSSLEESIFIPVLLTEEPEGVLSDVAYTLNLTHQ